MSMTEKLRILAVHRYFWPDTAPYGVILNCIVRRWVADGHDVEVLSTQPSYYAGSDMRRCKSIEESNGLRIRRLTLLRERSRHTAVRLVNIFLWTSAIFLHAVTRKRFDVIVISTNPPVVAAMAARYAAKLRGSKLLYHCMDIHPEIGRISGDFRNSLVFDLLQRIDEKTCQAAEHVVVLSTDMRAALRSRPNLSTLPVTVIKNFDVSTNDHDSARLPHSYIEEHKNFRVIFTGNIGRFQGLEPVVDAFVSLGETPRTELVLVGDGSAIADLKLRSGAMLGRTIHFYPYQPKAVIKRMLRSSDLCLVCLAPGISRYAYPHKTMTYLSERRPLLVCAEEDSELSSLVRTSHIGITVPPADSTALVKVLYSLSRDRPRYDAIENRSKTIGLRQFSKQEILEEWSRLIKTMY